MSAGDRQTRMYFGRRIVAVEGSNNDWSAYEGHAYWSEDETASSGDKLSYRVAVELFPELAERLAWRA